MADYVAEARSGTDLPEPHGDEFAFAGRSNVGKSTLINCLCQRRSLSRTSKTPGCTRGVVLFQIKLRSGRTLGLADLPGYGFAERSHDERRSWGALIEGFIESRKHLKAVLILVDARRGLQAEEHQLIDYLRQLGHRYVIVVTKTDKVSSAARGATVNAISAAAGAPAYGISGETGEGRVELLANLLRLSQPAVAAPG